MPASHRSMLPAVVLSVRGWTVLVKPKGTLASKAAHSPHPNRTVVVRGLILVRPDLPYIALCVTSSFAKYRPLSVMENRTKLLPKCDNGVLFPTEENNIDDY